MGVVGVQKIAEGIGGFTGTISASANLGFGFDAIGDIDGDGIIDIAAGAPYQGDGGTNVGAVWIMFMNSNQTVKAQQKISATAGNFGSGLENNDFFGSMVRGIGGIDGDGVPDMIIGSRADDDGGVNKGAVYIVKLNNDGTVKEKEKISEGSSFLSINLDTNDYLGTSGTPLWDLNNDGWLDFALSAYLADDGANGAGEFFILMSQPSSAPVEVVVETAGFESQALVTALATIDDTADQTTLDTALDDILTATGQTEILDSLVTFAATVSVAEPVKEVVDTETKTYVHAERVVDGTVEIENTEFSGSLAGITPGNTIVVTTAGEENTSIERPEDITGDLLIFDMVDNAGNPVTEGFSIDVKIEKENPTDTQIPTLVLLNEETGIFEPVGVEITDGGTTWNFTLTHFSTYAMTVASGFDTALGAVIDTKAIAALNYAKTLSQDASEALEPSITNNKVANGLREAAKASYTTGDGMAEITSLTNTLLDTAATSTIASITKKNS